MSPIIENPHSNLLPCKEKEPLTPSPSEGEGWGEDLDLFFLNITDFTQYVKKCSRSTF